MSGEKISRRCENCTFWRAEDPAGAVSNRGACSYLVGVELRSDREPQRKAPFWSYELARATISWEGEFCPTYKQGPNAKPDSGGRAL